MDYHKLLKLYLPVAMILVTLYFAYFGANIAKAQLYPRLSNPNDTEDPSTAGYDWVFHYCYANNLFNASKCGASYYSPLSHILAIVMGLGNIKLGYMILIALIVIALGLIFTFNSKIAFVIYFYFFFVAPIFLGVEFKSSNLIAYINTGFVPTLLILAMFAFQLYYWNKLGRFSKIAFIVIGMLIHHYAWPILLFTAILFRFGCSRKTIAEIIVILWAFTSAYSVLSTNFRLLGNNYILWLLGYILFNNRLLVFSCLAMTILAAELVQDAINRHNSK
jgi:hypothetical protein